jgi:hypothetical protein
MPVLPKHIAYACLLWEVLQNGFLVTCWHAPRLGRQGQGTQKPTLWAGRRR